MIRGASFALVFACATFLFPGVDGLGVVEPQLVSAYAGTYAVFEAQVDVDASDGGTLQVCSEPHSRRMVSVSIKPHTRSKWNDETRLSGAATCALFEVAHGEKGAKWNGLDGIYDLRLAFRVLADCSTNVESVAIRTDDAELQAGFVVPLKASCLGPPVVVTTTRPIGGGRIALTVSAAALQDVTYTVVVGEKTWPLRPPGGTITIPALGPQEIVEARISFKDGYSFRTPLYDQRNLSNAQDENGAEKAPMANSSVPGPSAWAVLVAVALLAVVSRRKPRRYA